MTILLVENSVLLIERLKDIIMDSGEGVQLHCTSKQIEAIELFEKIDPDVVIMDAYLPGNQSTDLYKKMKKRNEEVLIVILCYKAVFMNFDCYIQKNADFIIDKFHEFESIPSLLKSIAQSINSIQPK
ncbi:MAG: response regulator [Ferruginibacter sp.]